MRSVVLRLEGPIQAWSTQSKLGVRDTDREPSKSGVLGLLGAALGMERDDGVMLEKLRALSLAVRVDRPGSLLRDYHTAGGGSFRGRDYFVFDASDCIPSHRYYLQDASFTAALAGEGPLVERIAAALASPRWPLFLGRRACPPSVPPLLQVVDGDARSAVQAAPLAERTPSEPLRLVIESTAEQGAEPRYDVPLSFAVGDKRYGIRYVRTEWLEIPSVAVQDAEEART